MNGSLYFRVLGPLVVDRAGVPVDLGGPQRRIVLAVLLARVNQVVTVDGLVDVLWGESPPRSYRVQLQGLVSDLRRRLGGGLRSTAPILTRPEGYLLHLAEDQLDASQFRAAVAQARTAGTGRAVELLRTASAYWRGPAFTGLTCPVVVEAAAELDELRLATVEERIDAQLADGRLAGVGAELVGLVAEHPLRERFVAALMTVYARTGRVAEALACYRELRERCVTELGVEPSAEVRGLHRRILAAEVDALPVPDRATGVAASAYRQLPPDLATFTGRSAELATLLEPATPAALRVVALVGMGGVGKTSLAVRVAHRLVAEGRYADAQLYADLRGFSPGADPADPAAVLGTFLRLLGVPADRVPDGLAERSAVYRDRLVGQRVIVLLDNAADEDQVAPLLPSGAGCLVVVTSRRGLALPGVEAYDLDPFTAAEAVGLLASVAGAERVAAEPAASVDLAARCGYLPLTVALAAYRLRSRPAWPVRHLVDRLADESRRLDELSFGRRSVRAAFAVSYEALEPMYRRLFRLLAAHPGTDVTGASTAALAGLDPVTAAAGLEYLTDEHLLAQPVPGRYQMHDLLRAYATEVSSVDERQEAMSRVLHWYVAAADAVTRPIRSFPVPVRVPSPVVGVPVPAPAGTGEALAWLDAEYPNLAAAVRVAVDSWPEPAVLLAHIVEPYLIKRGLLTDWVALMRLASEAARRQDDPAAVAHTLSSLGHAYSAVGDTGEAMHYLTLALERHRDLSDQYGEAVALDRVGALLRRLGRHCEAVEHHRSAYALFCALGDEGRTAAAESNLSIGLHLLHRDPEALEHAHRALALQQRLRDPAGEASLRTNLGLMYARLGRHDEAIAQNGTAQTLFRAVGNRLGEANALANLSFSYARLARHDEALRAGHRSVELVDGEDADSYADALNSLAEAYRLAGRPDEAIRRHHHALTVAIGTGNVAEQDRARAGLAAASGGS